MTIKSKDSYKILGAMKKRRNTIRRADIISAYYVDRLPVPSIAARFKVSVSTVRRIVREYNHG